ncbi:winged helix-turn-helix domain-containing protein [Bradyrhizobium cenepequi]
MMSRQTDPLSAMRERIAELEEEVRQLRALLAGEQFVFPIEWNLRRQERLILASLYASGTNYRSRSALHYLISSGETFPQIVDVVVSNLRRKLPAGVSIINQRGEGYGLNSEGKKNLSKFVIEARR